MEKEIRILILEDVAADAELIERELHKGGLVFSLQRVETKEAFLKELEDLAPDLILSDYLLPQFDGLSALEIVKEKCPDVPFVLVSGAIGEDLAIEILKKGAADYVLKQRLSQLVPSVRRALREAELRTERKQVEKMIRESEEKYRAIFENTGTAVSIDEEDMTLSLINTKFEELFGYSKEEAEGKMRWTEMIVKDDLERMKEYHRLRRIDPDAAPKNFEFRVIDKHGNIKDVFATAAMIPGTKKSVASLLDVSERKRAQERINYLLDAITKAKEEWEMTFDNVVELVLLVDENLNIIRCNKGFAGFAGIHIKELIGRKCYEFFPCDSKQIGLCKVYFKTGGTLPRTEVEAKGHWFYISHCPVKDEKGKFRFSVVVVTDITDLKNIQQRLTESEKELKKRIKELEDFYEMSVGRELRMIELKKEIESLKEELSKFIKDAPR